MKIWSQCGAVCIAPEDDEERQACEIAVNALLRWSAELRLLAAASAARAAFSFSSSTCGKLARTSALRICSI